MGLKPGKYNPLKPDIELNDFKTKKRIGLKLDQGSGAMQVGTVSQDDSVHIRSAGKRIGDFDEQRSWKGGRGHENLSESPEGFWDSQNAWTMSDGFVMPTLLWRFGRGIRTCELNMPDKNTSATWIPLVGEYRHVSVLYTSTASYSARYVRMWIRRVGNPGTLTFKLMTNSGGDPGSALQTVTVDTDDVTDTVSVLQLFDWGASQSITGGTLYHIVLIGDSADNSNNHWEVGGDSSGTTGKRSSAGSTWTAITFDSFYYIAEADVARTFFSFTLNEAFYVVDKKDDGAVSQLWINGDRGKATSVSSSSLTDTARAWTTNRWAGAFVKIVSGTGVGNIREIASNTGNTLTITGDAWALDTTSQYIIYGTEWFTEITSTGLTVVQSEPVNSNNIIYFPQGQVETRAMVWTGTAYAFSNDGTNKAYFLEVLSAQGSTLLAMAYNDTNRKYVALGTPTAWANPPTAVTYGTQKDIGSGGYNITGLNQKDGLLYIFKEDSVFNMDKNLNTAMLQGGLDKTPFDKNGVGNIAHQHFIFFSWMHSVIRVYGTSLDDVGQDWSGYGLPEGREGVFSSFDSYTSLLIAGVDANTGTSSVLGFDGVGWHEILRAYDSNKRIRMVKVQVNPGTRNRTWVDCGGDFIFQEMPFLKGSPRLDSGVRYMHESVIESGAIDMGTASGLPKYVKEIAVFCKNLGGGNEIQLDYQVDDDVHTSNWTPASALFESPESVSFVGLEDIRKFAYRLRIRCGDNASPPMVEGVVPNGFARTPFKIVWTVRCRADNITSRGRLVKPDTLMRWLLDSARFPGRIQMTSQWELAHNFFVVIHPPRMFPYKPSTDGQAEESVFTLVLEEA